jgi:phage terminase large subunit GpA-like protein
MASQKLKLSLPTTTETTVLKNVLDKAFTQLKPPPNLTVSEWSDLYRHLPKYSAMPGRWNTDIAPYQRGMMDAIHEPDIDTVVIMAGSQVGKSETLNNLIGYHIHYDPCAMLMVQPTLETCEDYFKQRLEPMIDASPVLHERVNVKKSGERENTVRYKTFPGGFLSGAGANSPASLASKPLRIIVSDEVDRFPDSAGSEGDPISLAKRRTATYWNSLRIFTSTPVDKDHSKIETLFLQSDQRRFYLPCPDCGTADFLKWPQVKWNSEGGFHDTTTAHYQCEHCNQAIYDHDKLDMLTHGNWVSHAKSSGIAGFHLWEAYSPFVTFEKIVKDFLESKDNPLLLKVWTNTCLGETWEDAIEKNDPEKLYTRRETYNATCPMGALCLTAGVDVQKDRLEIEVRGWGIGEESWGIEYKILFGDPSEKSIWENLEQFLQKEFIHESGIKLKIACTFIDSGDGNRTQDVYDFCMGKSAMRIFAIKGQGGKGKPILSGQVKRKVGKKKKPITTFNIGVDDAKSLITFRLRKTEGPGTYHWHIGYTHEYMKQLCSEQMQNRVFKGRLIQDWIQKGPNEALDTNVYAFAAMKLLNPDFTGLKRALPSQPIAPSDITADKPIVKPVSKRLYGKSYQGFNV